MTTPTPAFLRDLAAAERMVAERITAHRKHTEVAFSRGPAAWRAFQHDACPHLSDLAGYERTAHARAAVFDALADEMEGK